jgi:hypothetical protein
MQNSSKPNHPLDENTQRAAVFYFLLLLHKCMIGSHAGRQSCLSLASRFHLVVCEIGGQLLASLFMSWHRSRYPHSVQVVPALSGTDATTNLVEEVVAEMTAS